MKKIAFVLAIVLVLSVPLPVKAAEPRAISVHPRISLDGATVTCTVTAMGNNTSEYFEATIRLYRAGNLIATWYEDGYGYINWTKTRNVPQGYTYMLTVDVSVNGNAVPQVSAST